MDGYVASYVVRSRENAGKLEKCVFTVCVETDDNCEHVYRCSITIFLRHGQFVWTG